MTGPFNAEKQYRIGDLFIKDFGLFLSDGEEAKLIAGRGPEGKKGAKGASGKDGADGKDGKDGDTFDCVDIEGTNLVIVMRDANDDLTTKSVDLSPMLDAAVDITKSVEKQTSSQIKAEVQAHAKGLMEYINEHLEDQDAIPLRFYRGLFSASNSYSRGDTVTYSGSLYVTSEATSAIPNSPFERGNNPWRRLGVGGGGGGGGGDGDLSIYVKRPKDNFDGKWLTYRETDTGQKEWTPLTTDVIDTNPNLLFRDANGRFAPTPDELSTLTNQLRVNRFIWDKLNELDDNKSGIFIGPLPPDKESDGMFWFCNNQNSMQLFVFHEDSDAWIPVAPPATISDRVAKGEDIQGALVEAVGDLETKVTALEGAIGEHSLIFNLAHPNPRAGDFVIKDGGNYPVHNISEAQLIHISPEDRHGGSIAVDRITEGDVMRLSDIAGVSAELKIIKNLGGGAYQMEKLFGELDRLSESPYEFNLFSSFDPAGMAQISYVDEQDAKKYDKSGGLIEGQVKINTLDLVPEQKVLSVAHAGDPKFYIHPTGQAVSRYILQPGDSDFTVPTKGYIDKAIADAIANVSPTASPRPAQLSWLFSPMTTGAPSTGAFMYTGANWRFSLKTWNGGDGFFITETVEKSWNTSQLVEMSIWKRDGMQWKMVKHVEIEKVYWMAKADGRSYLSFKQKWQSNDTGLSTNGEYFVTIGGFSDGRLQLSNWRR